MMKQDLTIFIKIVIFDFIRYQKPTHNSSLTTHRYIFHEILEVVVVNRFIEVPKIRSCDKMLDRTLK